MSARGFTKTLFKFHRFSIHIRLDKVTAVSLIKDNSSWHELYVLIRKRAEFTGRW